ncbi:MAG: LysM peptidoglycan-binding domain-containing protein, partial [Cyanobacteriota bacterium]|nr:LysM peptidoglycan-binding domain-containing protein [Cyanobacteriota bacterium]
PPGVNSRTASGKTKGATTVTVGEGETLSDIADRHGISVSTLIALNRLSDPDHVEVGQVLKVKGQALAAASAQKASAKPSSFSYTSGASEHVVRKGESLSAIARGYGVPMSQLVALNAITDPNNVHAGSTLQLKGSPPVRPSATVAPQPRPSVAPRREAMAPRPEAVAPRPSVVAPRPKPAAATTVAAAPRPATAAAQEASTGKSDWRSYGPFQVDWTSWQPMGGSMVAAVITAKGESLYTAINCGARKINSTTPTGQWGTWNNPASEVETKLVNDFCSRRAS